MYLKLILHFEEINKFFFCCVNLTGRRPTKVRHKEESVFAPRSLFDRPSPALAKMRRDMKLHKIRGMVRPLSSGMSGLKPPLLKSPNEQENILEWTIHEDWSLLQSIQVYQSLPLNLVVLSPGQTPNWDLVADIVNNTARIYRSPKQCRNRYEAVIVPREEGKLLYDTTPKKQKKQKGVYKTPQVADVRILLLLNINNTSYFKKKISFFLEFLRNFSKLFIIFNFFNLI